MLLVPGGGIEPTRLIRPRDFKSRASANSATRARQSKHSIKTGMGENSPESNFANDGWMVVRWEGKAAYSLAKNCSGKIEVALSQPSRVLNR